MKLIDKSAIVAEINQRIKDYKSHKIDDSYHDGLIFALEDLRDDFLDTLEVEEVNLDGEINLWVRNLPRVPNFEELNKFARHFFELGLKAQKGENAKDERYVVGVTGKYTTTTK